MISFDEASAIVRAAARPLGAETVRLAEAHGRVLAEPVAAEVSAPPADVSAMDGYAVRDGDLSANPVRLRVIGETFAGSRFSGEIEAGTCVRIFTGAPVPDGADRVVVQEMVRREDDIAIIDERPGPARHIRRAGGDFAKGEVLLEPGSLLGPRQLVAAAGADVDALVVWRQPRVIVLGTGDELVAPGSARNQDEAIPERVSFGVAALAEQWGGRCVGRLRLADRIEELEQGAARALAEADLVVVTGGASVGERDFAKAMFEAHGLELLFSKVAIKPGKPVWLGRAAGTLVLGLPGNPTSVMVTARLFLAPLLAGMTGRDPGEGLRWRQMPLASEAGPVGARETFARGRAEGEAVTLASNQDSSAQKTLAACDLLVRLRPGDVPVPVGSLAEVIDF